MDTSTCWPSPVRRACRHPVSAPAAAKAPVSHSTNAPPAETGGRSGTPRRTVAPQAACTVNSVAGRSAHGPSVPHGLIDTTTRLRLTAVHSRGAMPAQWPTPGTYRAMSTSASVARARAASGGTDRVDARR
jgi:hypothetical protein